MYPQIFGKYVLEREISRGGMARLCLATLRGASGFEKRLVVKQIRDELAFDEEWVRRFVEEAKTTVALSHPNIVPVYELGIEQGIYFLAMELVEGVSLAELMKAGGVGKLSPEEGAYMGIEVCRALDYAHRRVGVVHRDVTPRNVMVDEEGQVKVIDFGIAAPARVAGHEVFGSPGHMPPEQVDGKELGPATDVFAVAVLLMEAWSGRAPFRRATQAECDEAMHKEHPKPSEADIRLLPLDEIIARAMSLDVSKRPQEADELGRVLRKFLSGVDTSDLARALGERVRKVRDHLRAQAAKDKKEGKGDFRASQASFGDLQTKTFAAREEVEKIEQPGATPSAAFPSTRKIDDSIPPTDPRREPTVKNKRISVPPETIATRPIETPVKPIERESPKTNKRTAMLFVATVIGVAAATVGVMRLRELPGGANPVATTTATTSSVTTANPTTTTNPTGTTPTTATTNPTAPTTTTLATTATPSAPASTGAAATASSTGAKSHLALYGDPGTRVTVDGVARGSCPQRDLALDPGVHDVRFTFDPTGESRGERVEVRPGEKVTLRADFTGAIPTIRVQR